jgi:hypothetical protein
LRRKRERDLAFCAAATSDTDTLAIFSLALREHASLRRKSDLKSLKTA